MADEPKEPGADAAEDAAEPKKKAAKAPKPPKKPKEKKAKGKGKGFNVVLLLVPVAVIAALVLAFLLPPTHALLANGPLKPLLSRFSHDTGKGPKAQASADPVAEAKRLSDQVATEKKNAATKDAQIAQLQSQVNQLQATPEPSPTPIGSPTPAVISDEVKRVATYWAGMDADKAAEIVKQLPDPYVKLVFSQMPADAVSDIMSALPAKTSARLTAGPPGDAP